MKYLPIVYANGNNGVAREQMALAAYEAGVCINNSSVTLVHGMSRPIGALFHVPHGKSNAMLLAKCLGFAADGAYDRFAKLGRACGLGSENESDIDVTDKFLETVSEVVKACEIPTLSAYGIDKDKFMELIPKMSEDAIASGSPGNTIKNVTKEDCEKIYSQLINQ